MAEFTATTDTSTTDAVSQWMTDNANGNDCLYVPTYTVQWRNFYDTTLDLEYLNTDGTLIKWFNNLTPSPSGD